jgi:hypothetical protein
LLCQRRAARKGNLRSARQRSIERAVAAAKRCPGRLGGALRDAAAALDELGPAASFLSSQQRNADFVAAESGRFDASSFAALIWINRGGLDDLREVKSFARR